MGSIIIDLYLKLSMNKWDTHSKQADKIFMELIGVIRHIGKLLRKKIIVVDLRLYIISLGTRLYLCEGIKRRLII